MATWNDRSKPHGYCGGWWGVNPPPRDWDRWGWKTVTTNGTSGDPFVLPSVPAPIDEERIRKIVREEVADLIPVDLPDALPEDWTEDH